MRFFVTLAALCLTALGCGTISLAWPDIKAAVVSAIIALTWAVVVVLTLCACALAGGFTFWRLKVAQADARIADSAATFASEVVASPVQPMKQTDANLWDKGYLDLGWLGFTIGTLSLARMRPHFQENAERLWRHMVDEMKRTGWATVKTAFTDGGRPYRVTVFAGSYRRFFRLIISGELRLAPRPKTAPPVISAKYAQLETTETLEMTEITERTK